MTRMPSPAEYRLLPFEDKLKVIEALKARLAAYAQTERTDK